MMSMSKKARSKPWEYGRSPNPRNWHEAADAIRSLQQTPARKSSLTEKLDVIAKLLKEKQHHGV